MTDVNKLIKSKRDFHHGTVQMPTLTGIYVQFPKYWGRPLDRVENIILRMLCFLQLLSPMAHRMGMWKDSWMDVAMAITLVPTKLDLLTFDNESDNTELFFNDTHLVKNIFKIRRDVLFWNQVRVILQGRMFENKTSELMLVGINSTRFNNARRFDARDRKSEWLHAYFNIFLSILADIGKKLLVYKSIQNNLDTVLTPKLFGLDFHDALFNVKNEDSDYACAFSDCFTITNTNEEELRPTTTYSLDFIRKPGLKIDFCERFLEAEVDYFRKHIPLIVDKKPDRMEFCLRLEGYTP